MLIISAMVSTVVVLLSRGASGTPREHRPLALDGATLSLMVLVCSSCSRACLFTRCPSAGVSSSPLRFVTRNEQL